jgi:hypothetical protein
LIAICGAITFFDYGTEGKQLNSFLPFHAYTLINLYELILQEHAKEFIPFNLEGELMGYIHPQYNIENPCST